MAVAVPPLPSLTVNVILCIPSGRFTAGLAPVAVPNVPDHEYVSGSPLGSDEPMPFRVVLANPAEHSST